MSDQPIAADVLAEQIQHEIDFLEAGIEAHEERICIQHEHYWNDLTTTERAQEALTRPERFRGEHAVATAWLREHAPSIWIHGHE